MNDVTFFLPVLDVFSLGW